MSLEHEGQIGQAQPDRPGAQQPAGETNFQMGPECQASPEQEELTWLRAGEPTEASAGLRGQIGPDPGAPELHRSIAEELRRDPNGCPETAGFPPIAGGGDVRDYYERYLRKKHPEYDDETIGKKVESAMQDKFFRESLEGMMELDEGIREGYPEQGWTTWFDDLNQS